MLEKQVETRNILDKKSLTTWMKFGILAELTFLAGSYLGYRKLNHDIEARLFLYKHCYFLLDKFYLIGERDKDFKCRESDLQHWKANNQI